jgi:Asp-tRNA(Asn)/Glu-tRNA(Gln) amidotransferase A subunit family amidase
MSPPSFHQPASALELLDRYRADPSSRRSDVRERLERIRSLDATLRAMQEVVDIEHAVSASDAATGPLGGLPVVVKDIFDTHDLPTAYGSPIHAGHRPASDAALVTMLRRAGAALLGKSVTCEFAYMSPSATRNPFDVERTPGGSSSGSAAAVAAGYAPLAIGSQTGGSIIRPASFCGIAGFKPTFGLLPTAGMKCFSWSFDTVGLFAAGVRDVAHFAEALVGRSLAIAPPPAWTFGVPESYPWTAPSDSARSAMQSAVRAIEQAGGQVRPIRFESWMGELIEVHANIQGYEASRTLGFEFDRHREQLSPLLREYLERAAGVTADRYFDALASMHRARAATPAMFDGIDAILTPSAPDEAPLGFGSTGDPAFNRNWTLLGTPCVNVPGLRGSSGAPMGVQVIGQRGADGRTLAAARFVESVIGQSAPS